MILTRTPITGRVVGVHAPAACPHRTEGNPLTSLETSVG